MSEITNEKMIPNNYNTIDSKKRNFIETAIMDGIYIYILYSFHLTFKQSMYFALLLIPLTVFGIMGIAGQSLFTALYNYVRFLRRRRVLDVPTQEYIRKKNKAVLKKKQKEMAKKKESINEKDRAKK